MRHPLFGEAVLHFKRLDRLTQRDRSQRVAVMSRYPHDPAAISAAANLLLTIAGDGSPATATKGTKSPIFIVS
jgi:hypothetical protein